MNKIYRVIWNKVACQWRVVGELAANQGKGGSKSGGSPAKPARKGLLIQVMAALLSLCAGAGVPLAGLLLSAQARAGGGLIICPSAGSSDGATWGSGSAAAGTRTSCPNPPSSGWNWAFHLTNDGDATGNTKYNQGGTGPIETAGITGYADGVLELKGDAGVTIVGSTTFKSKISMSGQKITGLANGEASADAVNFGQLTSLSTTASTGIGSLSTGLSTTNSNLSSLSTGLSSTNSNVSSLSTSLSSVHSTGTLSYFKADGKKDGSDDAWVTTGSNSAAIGANSSNGSRSNVVSMGSVGHERQIINVAPGTANTDAVNVGQLASLSSSISSGLGSLSSSVGSLGSNVDSLSTGLSTNSSNIASLSSSLSSITTGSNSEDTMPTRGVSGTEVKNVMPSACSSVNGIDATGSGLCAQATKDGATAIGSNAQATDTNTTAIGYRSVASSAGAVAIGHNARATGDPTVAIGDSSLASGNDAVALGAGAQASANRSVALGAFSVADQANTVSVGAAGSERRITNVAAGIDPTDAVNLSQLRDVASQVGNVARIAYSGVAMGMAMSGAVMPTLDRGEKGLGAGIGAYRGYTALALQFKAMSASGSSSWGAGVSSTGKEVGVQAGYGFKWK